MLVYVQAEAVQRSPEPRGPRVRDVKSESIQDERDPTLSLWLLMQTQVLVSEQWVIQGTRKRRSGTALGSSYVLPEPPRLG